MPFPEYDSDAACHYKVELSYENFITSGPDPHPPPIADDESDDDDDDDMPRVRYCLILFLIIKKFPFFLRHDYLANLLNKQNL